MFSYNDDDDSFVRALALRCECGHTVGEHSSHPLWSLNVIVASICALCNCQQFKTAEPVSEATEVEP